jgi:hypothetical protein
MKSAFALLVVGAVTSNARAESLSPQEQPKEPSTFLAGGAGAGLIDRMFTGTSATFEAGHRLGASSLWLHAKLIDYQGGDNDSAVLGEAGVELRPCGISPICPFAGADVGASHVVYIDNDSQMRVDHEAPVVAGHAGVDLGSNNLRLRLQIELGAPATITSSLTAAVRW